MSMNIRMTTTAAESDATLTQLLKGHTLAEALTEIAQRIRQEPQSVAQRMLYFDVLCLTGAWEKALPTLQNALKVADAAPPSENNPALMPVAYVCRQLVQAEIYRASVFAGTHAPAFSVVSETASPQESLQNAPPHNEAPDNTSPASDSRAAKPATAPASFGPAAPQWLSTLWNALRAQQSGDLATADSLRLAAFAQAPDSAGEVLCSVSHADAGSATEGAAGATTASAWGTTTFTWLADTDSRLGPVLEVIVQGRYVWLPFCHIQSLEVQGPRSVRDLLWLPATLTLHTGEDYACFVPGRYAGSEQMQTDALLLGRETHWHNVGETGVVALGQKTFTCDGGDVPLYDVRRLTLHAHPNTAQGKPL